MPRNRIIAIGVGVIVIIIIVVVIVANRDDDSSTNTVAANSNQTASSTASGASQSQAAQDKTVTFVAAETCHTLKLAGGNSDVLVAFDVIATPNADGALLRVIFKSSKREGDIVGDGKVVGKRLFVRVPVVAYGEQLTLKSIVPQTGDNILPASVRDLKTPAYTVPDASGSKCDFDKLETSANGTINQPNPANASLTANAN